jgi:hypothetical protein
MHVLPCIEENHAELSPKMPRCRKYAKGLLYRHFDRLRFFFGANGIIHLQLLYGPKFLRLYAVPIPRCI